MTDPFTLAQILRDAGDDPLCGTAMVPASALLEAAGLIESMARGAVPVALVTQERTAKGNHRKIAALRVDLPVNTDLYAAPVAVPDEPSMSHVDLARSIRSSLRQLGFAVEPSREHGADERVDRVATMLAYQPPTDRRDAESSDPEECWSADEENFSFDSLEELIDADDNLYAGGVVYRGEKSRPTATRLCDAEDVIDQMRDRASEIAGDYADDFLSSVSEEAKAELDDLLEAWLNKHEPINFWQVLKVTEYTLTPEDFDEDDERRLGDPDEPACTSCLKRGCNGECDGADHDHE